MSGRDDEYDILTTLDICRTYAIDERTLRRWIDGKYFPRPTMFGRRKGWRRGLIRRYMEATEFLQGLGLTALVPADDGEDDNDTGHLRTPTGHSRTSDDPGGNDPSAPRKSR